VEQAVELIEAGDTLRVLTESLGVIWFDVRETAGLVKRSEETISALLSRHQLPRRTYARTIRRRKVWIVQVSPATVRWLQDLVSGKDPGPVPTR
jgi:hypothetical protein